MKKTVEDNSYLFDNLKISDAGDKYKAYMGQYPVISISLKSMKQSAFNDSFEQFKNLVQTEVWRHRELLTADCIMTANKNTLKMICNDTADDSIYWTALRLLSDCLYEYYEKKVILLIDEYDVPLENAYFNGFYDKMLDLIRSVFECVLKTNDSLEFGVLTGCLRISKESIFTGLNNLSVHSITSSSSSDCFGFTEKEVCELLDYYNLADRFDDLKKWYDGYLFGNTDIYNPWSIVKFIQETLSGEALGLQPYWVNTSSNSIIHELISKSDRRIRDEIEKLITGDSINKPLFEDITYVNMDVKSEYIWSFLLHTGYLKPVRRYMNGIQTYFEAVIPNLEVVTIYENTFRQWFDDSVRAADKSVLLKAVLNGDAETFQLEVNRWLLKSISYHDGYENFYHGFLVGLLDFSDDYLVESNREAGTSRSDIIIKNVLTHDSAVIIEIKSADSEKELDRLCDAALTQIEDKQYEINLKNEGDKNIIKFGIAFCGKRCIVKNR